MQSYVTPLPLVLLGAIAGLCLALGVLGVAGVVLPGLVKELFASRTGAPGGRAA